MQLCSRSLTGVTLFILILMDLFLSCSKGIFRENIMTLTNLNLVGKELSPIKRFLPVDSSHVMLLLIS